MSEQRGYVVGVGDKDDEDCGEGPDFYTEPADDAVPCSPDKHQWHHDADAEGDTCNCGEWYRFADRIERTNQ